MSWRLSSNSARSRSVETKTTSNDVDVDDTASYVSVSFAVNDRHGGLQWAPKYSPIVFPVRFETGVCN